MPPRRSRSGVKRKPIDQEKENSIKQTKQEYDKQLQELMKLYDDVDPDKIFKCKHPLESLDEKQNRNEKSHTKPITLTPIQKAITFCIQHNGGSATDDEVLAFIHRFWSTIVTFSLSANSNINYQYSKMIDKRVLRINFATAKDNQHLFEKIDENRWRLNSPTSLFSSNHNSQKTDKNSNSNNNSNNTNSTPSSQVTDILRPRNSTNTRASANSNSFSYSSNSRPTTRSSNSNSRDSFQEKILEILRNVKNQSLPIDEIINKATEFKDEDGLYQGLPINQRVKCVLMIKQVLNEVFFDEDTSKWCLQTKPIEKQKNYYLPKDLKGVRMKELTATELWNLLKEKYIY